MSKNKYIADKSFYLMALSIALPMIGQVMVTNFVSLLDNVMIGQIGTNEMNGVAIINQLVFVFNLTIFGAMSGPGIFGAQFFGKKDFKGQRYTFCFRLILSFLLSFIAIIILIVGKDFLINMFISETSDYDMQIETYKYASEYLKIILFTLLPFALSQALVSVLRESNETKVPMYGSLSAIGVNLFFNYCLIFGKLGFPKLGVAGGAIATVIAKLVEMTFLIIYAMRRTKRFPYFHEFYKGFKIPTNLIKGMVGQGWPLIVNEFLWSLAVAIIAQCYSYRGLEVVAARNIASTLTNLYSTIYLQMGCATGIIIGQVLGQSDFTKAKEYYFKLVGMILSIALCVVIIVIPLAFVFPEIYNTTTEIKSLATFYLIVMALAIPIHSYTNICYFVLRSGGKSLLTFMYDAGFSWIIQIPVAWLLCYKTDFDIKTVMIIVTYIEGIKVIIGYRMVNSGIWIQNLVNDE